MYVRRIATCKFWDWLDRRRRCSTPLQEFESPATYGLAGGLHRTDACFPIRCSGMDQLYRMIFLCLGRLTILPISWAPGLEKGRRGNFFCLDLVGFFFSIRLWVLSFGRRRISKEAIWGHYSIQSIVVVAEKPIGKESGDVWVSTSIQVLEMCDAFERLRCLSEMAMMMRMIYLVNPATSYVQAFLARHYGIPV